MVAAASDTPAIPVPGNVEGLPVTPAKLTYRIDHLPARPESLPGDRGDGLHARLPSTSDMWHTYARGTHMNMVQMGTHRYWYQPGAYLFKLTPEPSTRGS